MKTDEIYAIIKDEIKNKKYKIGDKLPGEYELMSIYDVTRSTIREVLAGLTKEGIIEKIAGKGSFVTRVPSLGTIAVCARYGNLTASANWFSTLIRAVNDYAEALGYEVMLMVAYGETIDKLTKSVHSYFNKTFSKEIIALVNTMGFELSDIEVPVVNVNGFLPLGDNSVYLDYEEIVDRSKSLFSAFGYKEPRILYISDSADKTGEKNHNYMEYLVSRFTDKKENVLKLHKVEEAYDVFDKWYKSESGEKSLFVFDDGIMDYILRYFYERCLKIPKDLALVTHANKHKKFNFGTEFYRFGFDYEEVAKIIIDTLGRAIKGDEVGHTKISPVFMPGKSL